MLTLLAPAKINLLLSVGATQPSGLHELVSVMQSVSLFDEVTVGPAEEFSIAVEGDPSVPSDNTNLALKAARAFAALHLHPKQGVEVHLVKRIPVGGGLAGGSTDAAAVLLGLREATGGEVSRKALERLAAPLGSDVPFCVRGGTCVVEGTGERLTTLPVAQPLWWVIGTTSIACDTGAVYERFDQMTGSGTIATGDLDLAAGPHELADALSKGDLERVAGLVSNDLEAAALDLHPELASGRDALRAAEPLAVVLAGSGSSWLALCRDQQDAERVANLASDAFDQAICVSSTSGPQIQD